MSDPPNSAKTIFLNALEMPSEARQAYIAEQCGRDDALSAEVQALLRHHQELGSFMEPESAPRATSTEARALTEVAGMMIGPYKLLEQIGEGGMGIVFMAEQQEPVRRKVAIKLIKPGMDTRQVVARFEAERQALAVMDHPGIARVLDAGATPAGHPFFVMELVRGVPITTYCDENNLPIRERLELFAAVCLAIQHAHTKGIIHRDIKPSNVLITRQDGRAVAKVIDFGVAKAMGHQLTEKTLFTNFAQIVGTPLYMSPEQAERSSVDIDTRSDIYSLGVLLYELLTGSTPVNAEQLKRAAFDEIRRIIREEEPPTPSARISGSHTLPSIAAHRHTEPARLRNLVRGELDWIAMKALDKDRNRRYETASAFAADLSHYLNDEPVLACPPSTIYRLGKFARCNRAVLTTAALVSAALMVGITVSTWQAIRAEQARAAEAEQRAHAEKARAAEATQRQIADEQRVLAESERAGALKQRAVADANYQRAKAAVDKYFTLVSESTLFEVPGMQPLRKDLLESALEFYEGAALERSSDPAVLTDIAVTHLRVGSVYLALNRSEDFIVAVRRALDTIDQLHSHPQATDQERKLAGFWKGKRWTRSGVAPPRDIPGAILTLTRLEKTWEGFIERHPADVAFRSDLGGVQAMMSIGFTGAGRRKEGLAYARKAFSGSERIIAEAPLVPQYRSDMAGASLLLARNLIAAGEDPDEALRLTRLAAQFGESLVAEFPANPTYRADLVECLIKLSEQTEREEPEVAQESSRRALALAESLVREFPDHQPFVRIWLNAVVRKASCGRSQDDPSQVAELVEQVIEACELQAKLRPNDLRLRDEYAFYCFRSAKELARHTAVSERLHRRALELYGTLAGAEAMCGYIHQHLAWIARDTGRLNDALGNYDRGVAVFEKLANTDTPADGHRATMANMLLEKSAILTASGRNEEAAMARDHMFALAPNDPNALNGLAWQLATAADPKARDARMAVKLATRGVALDPKNKNLPNTLGVAHFHTGNWQEAVQWLMKSVELNGGNSFDWLFLAMAHWQLGEQEEARKWFDQAAARMEKSKVNEELKRFRAEAEELMKPEPLGPTQEPEVQPES